MTAETIIYRQATEAQLRELHAHDVLMWSERAPGLAPLPFEAFAASARTLPPYIEVITLVERDGTGRIAGLAGCALNTKDNTHLVEMGIAVRADLRRRGLGRTLLARVVDLALAHDRRLLLGVTSERVPAGEAFARAMGAEAGLAMHVNRLDLATVDRALLERWVAEAATRAADYELVGFDGRIPEHLLGPVAEVVAVLNDAPRDGLDVEDEKVDADSLRARDDMRLAQSVECWWLLARHRPSGQLVGFHDVRWHPARPQLVQVGGTGVRPEHRGHALGKWLKAAMTLRILDERPEATEVWTGNADSNAAMLAINHEMGYRPHIADQVWQADVERVRERLTAAVQTV